MVTTANSLPYSEGTVLAPLSFLIFINDIIQGLHCTIRLYADVILIYFTIRTPEDCVLQHDLISLHTWAEKWQMEFNPSKCMHLTSFNKHHHSYYISNYLIQKVSNAKYLGVIFDEHLTWKITFMTSVPCPMLLKIKFLLQEIPTTVLP